MRNIMNLFIETQDVVVGICTYQGLRTILNNLLYSSLLSKNLKIKVKIKIKIFACCFVWVWNLVGDSEGGMQAESIWE
jgi:hypothetical protein